MSWYSFRPYVSVAQRRRQAEAAAKKMSKKGRALAPVRLTGRTISSTFWGKAWCDNLESYSDYENRLPRGRTYVRNGSVIDLQISNGKIEALVQGSDLYKISIEIATLAPKRWRKFTGQCAGKVSNLLDLLQGRLSKDILADITAQDAGLFPAPKEIKLDCSCPDWADMCKHVAAVLYGVGARLDAQPELFFSLRGVDMQELITAASVSATAPLASESAPVALEGADLTEIFGVEMESGPSTAAAASPSSSAKRPAASGSARKRRATGRPARTAVPSKPRAKPGARSASATKAIAATARTPRKRSKTKPA